MSEVGRNWDIINVTLNNTTDTEVTYPFLIKAFFLKTRNGTTLYLRKTNNAANFITFPSGQILNSELILANSNLTLASLGFWRTDNVSGDIIEGYVIYS